MKRISVFAVLAIALIVVLHTAPNNVAVAQEPPTPTEVWPPAWYNQVGKLDLSHECDRYNNGYLVLQDGTRAKVGVPDFIYIQPFDGKMVWMQGFDSDKICHDPVFWSYYWSPVQSFEQPWPEGEHQTITGYVAKTEDSPYNWLFKQFVENPDGVGLIVEHDPTLVEKLTGFASAKTRVEIEVVHTVDWFGTTPDRIWWVFDAHEAPTPTPITPEPYVTPTPTPVYHAYLPAILGIEDGAQPAQTFVHPVTSEPPTPTVCPFPTCLP